jgi:hypothetical protein
MRVHHPVEAADRLHTTARKEMTTLGRKTLLTAIIAICVAAATAGCATTEAEVTTSSSASNTSVAAPGSPRHGHAPRDGPTSLEYQTRFARAVPALVVGRNIDEVNLSKVAGSSGTPDGFNAAIQQIKAEATT